MLQYERGAGARTIEVCVSLEFKQSEFVHAFGGDSPAHNLFMNTAKSSSSIGSPSLVVKKYSTRISMLRGPRAKRESLVPFIVFVVCVCVRVRVKIRVFVDPKGLPCPSAAMNSLRLR